MSSKSASQLTATTPSSLGFPVVGIGASAGGIQALTAFFEHMPSDNGMAFVVVLHLAPSHQSHIDSILQRATKMRVTEVAVPTRIEKNTVYVISPSKQLTMNDGYLRVTELERPPGQHVAVDIFFRTLAEAHRTRAFGIVLSGTGADGAVGLAKLKEEGGVAIAQHPDDAEFAGMPNAAIQAGVVDFVLPVCEIPQKLIDVWRNSQAIELPPVEDGEKAVREPATVSQRPDAEDALRDVISILRTRTGHDFRHYKRATVLRRIERRLQVRAVPDIVRYRDLLKSDPEENKALLKDMLIGVTQFFRDREVFDSLERDFIAQLFEGRDASEQIRVWSAGCSTGEEAYSLAILLCEHADTLSSPPAIQVFATDIDENAIAVARGGRYPSPVMTDIPPARLRQFFAKEGDQLQIKKAVRDKVLFAAHNILRDPPFSKLDMISCRNLLIYLEREIQGQVLEMFHFALNPDGLLMLGSSESADMLPEHFVPVDKKNRIYRAKNMARSTRYSASMPVASFSPPIPAPARTFDRRKFSFEEIHQRALAKHAPPSVVVNHDAEIMHMSHGAGKYLRYIGGEPTRNLLSLVMPELRLEVRAALFQAAQTNRDVEARRIVSERDGRVFHVHMAVHPFHDDTADIDLFLIRFNEVEQVALERMDGEPGRDNDAIIGALEEDLQRTKALLQDTIEHSETSTEELKASNEELQAINEELRSATEELETSKEELQSVNEELVTVNFELKCTVEETAKVNDDLQNLIASTDIATIFVDRSMRIKRYTPRAADIFNIIPADIGRSLHDITHKLAYDELASDAAAAFDTLRVVEREVHSSDGCYYISRLLPYRTTDDRIEGAILTFIDITRRYKAEEDLRFKEETMRLVAESTKDYAIMTLDMDGRVTSFNKGAGKMFGYAEEEILGQSGDVIFTPEDRGNGAPEEERRRAREEGRAEDERWHLRKDGTRFFCSGVMTPLLDNGGGLYGYAKIGRDLTGRVQVENQRNELLSRVQLSRAEVQAASELKDEFLAIMSHELKYPLNLIHMNAELLMHMPELAKNPIYARAAETVLNSAANQAKIINDLLDLSRLNTGKLALSVTAVDLVKTVRSIVALARNEKDACEIALEGPQEQPLLVKGDALRIEQVIWNLVSNALKFTPPEGTIRVCLSSEGEQARIDVIDSGQGISPQFLPHVFDMFRQAVKSDASKAGGLGIGMALAKHIVELHGGKLTAASAGLGKGAQFTLCLPLIDESEQPEESPTDSTADCIAGLKILAVDDHVDGLETFKMLLELYGADVDVAGHAHVALGLLSGKRYDLIISDIGMPDMDGYGFIREVRKYPMYADTPVIALTGYGRSRDVERALKAGFSDHLSKPVAIEKLLEVVKRLQMRAGDGV